MASTALTFKLDSSFMNSVESWADPFAGNPLGKFVYDRTYSRHKSDETYENWSETCQRVVEGCYTLQQEHIEKHALGWDDNHGQRSAQEMFERLYNHKFLASGRALWCLGTDVVHQRELDMALYNCAFISTKDLDKDPTMPFCFLMDVSMLGVGCGADTKGKDKAVIYDPIITPNQLGLNYYTVSDTREGWVDSVKQLLKTYFLPDQPDIIINYSEIRPEGQRLKTFGGKSSGAGPLIDLHIKIREVLIRDKEISGKLSSTGIVDIFNLIGCCVIAGNVRRTAEIMFGEHNDKEFLDLKNYNVNAQRAAYGWTSNNSIFAEIGMDYSEIAKRIMISGEPGLAWLDNMRQYGRMCDPPDNRDHKVLGGNPCLEISLESAELCNLVETVPVKHDSLEDFLNEICLLICKNSDSQIPSLG
jgi:ribonucleoside-triphosphate reductase